MRAPLSIICGTVLAAAATTSLAATIPEPTATDPIILTATTETRAVYDDEAGGNANADDPAIWVNPKHRENSVVLGTLKEGGLDVYDLSGALLQHVDAPAATDDDSEAGRFNNVDVFVFPSCHHGRPGRYNGLAVGAPINAAAFIGGHGMGTLLGAAGHHHGTGMGAAGHCGMMPGLAIVSDRGRDQLRTYLIDPRGAQAGDRVVRDISANDLPWAFAHTPEDVAEQATAYGVTARTGHDGKLYAIASQRNQPHLGMYELSVSVTGVTYTKVAELELPSQFNLSDGTTWTPCGDPGEGPQVEGMVVDRQHDVLYAAQETVGLWRIPLHGGSFGTPELVDRVAEFGQGYTYDEVEEECELAGDVHPDGGDYLVADAEGVSIAYHRDRPATLFASSQGDDRLVEYALDDDFTYKATYVVGDSDATDGTQHTDGTDVYAGPLGPNYPNGLLVVHDGEETPVDGDRESTNFKFVPAPFTTEEPSGQ